ncbi:MAG: LuxR C-terminal-related transcriptional regulator [Candidatus Doudnabacteria bacterium]|nr:LuxR C-terminal-related transcriptional regulator [Candidatus Doudnabacteria bacterium]
MTKLSRKPLSNEKLGLLVNNIWLAFLSMKTKEEMRVLFRDLFTHTEYKMLAKRLEVARRLIDGEHYEEISRELNISEKTIAHVSNILAQKGEGLRKAHNNLKGLEQKFRKKTSTKFPRYKGMPHLSELIKA